MDGVIRIDRVGGLLLAATGALLAGLIFLQGAALGHALEGAAVLIGIVALLAGWKDERVLLALFVASFLTVSNPALRLKLGGLWVPVPALLAGVLCAREAAARMTTRVAWPALPFAALFLLGTGMLASGLAVTNLRAYAAELVKWGAHVLVFATLVLALRRARWVYAALDGFSVVVGVLAAYGLIRVFSGQAYDIDVFEGVASRSAAAFYLTSQLPLVYARLFSATGWQRLLRLGLFGLLATAQVFTYTRSAWIASTCGLLFVAGRRVRAYLVVGLAAAVVIAAAPQAVRDRFQTIFVAVDYGVDSPLASSTVVREHLLQTGIAMVQGNWLLGVGMGNYWDNYHRYAVPGSPLVANTPHNFWLLLWAEGGLVSMLAFAWLYAARVRSTWRARRSAAGEMKAVLLGCTGSLVALAVESCFSNDLNLIITWVLLGISVALVHLAGAEPVPAVPPAPDAAGSGRRAALRRASADPPERTQGFPGRT